MQRHTFHFLRSFVLFFQCCSFDCVVSTFFNFISHKHDFSLGYIFGANFCFAYRLLEGTKDQMETLVLRWDICWEY